MKKLTILLTSLVILSLAIGVIGCASESGQPTTTPTPQQPFTDGNANISSRGTANTAERFLHHRFRRFQFIGECVTLTR